MVGYNDAKNTIVFVVLFLKTKFPFAFNVSYREGYACDSWDNLFDTFFNIIINKQDLKVYKTMFTFLMFCYNKR